MKTSTSRIDRHLLVHVDLVLQFLLIEENKSHPSPSFHQLHQELDYENLVFILLGLRHSLYLLCAPGECTLQKKTFTCWYSELPSAVSGDTHGVGRHAVVGVPACPARLINSHLLTSIITNVIQLMYYCIKQGGFD